jgi:hypothetical protein
MVVRRLDLEERVDLDNVEGTSEASLAASVPRVSTDALPTQEPAQDLAGRTADCKVGTGTAAATKGCCTGQVRVLVVVVFFGKGATPSRNYPKY